MSASKSNRKAARKGRASPHVVQPAQFVTAHNAELDAERAASMLADLAAVSDPIHAAIERHRAAFLAWCLAGIPDFDQPGKSEPGYSPALTTAHSRAWKVKNRAGMALTTVQPTTVAGVLALFEYVATFNAGDVRLPGSRGLAWQSTADGWPAVPMPDPGGDADLFAFALIENAGRALAAIAGAQQ